MSNHGFVRSAAYYDGLEAGEGGYPYINPYHLGEDNYDDFEDGWSDGRAQYLADTVADL